MLTRLALSNDTAVLVAVLIVALLGTVSLLRLPVQLTPDVDQPRIVVETLWPSAAPQEVESELIQPQEDVLRGVPALTKVEAQANPGRAWVNLNFEVGTDLRRALVAVMDRLNRVSGYPPDVDEPTIEVGGNTGDALAWYAVRARDSDPVRPVASHRDLSRRVIATRLERVEGVERAEVIGGQEREVRVSFNPVLAAAHGVEIPEVANRLAGNRDRSAGFVSVGRREYTVRFEAGLAPSQLPNMLLSWDKGRPLRLADIAIAEVRMRDPNTFLSHEGKRAIAISVHPEQGANVLDTVTALETAVSDLNTGALAEADLHLVKIYDKTGYVDAALGMVGSNLLLGVSLAVLALWGVLRRWRATLVLAAIIPASVLVVFSVLLATDRSLNVISLAGIAFAVGMVLDAGIIVLDNIVRLRESGRGARDAALEGTSQVAGALVASVVTTVSIFLPILFLDDTAGQLFADLAITISVAVVASLAAALTVIPGAARRWLYRSGQVRRTAEWSSRFGWLISRSTDSTFRRTALVIGLVLSPVLLTWLFVPGPSYLPQGQRNLIQGFINGEPGISPPTADREIVKVIDRRLQPFLDGQKSPVIDTYFLGMFGGSGFFGIRAEDSDAVPALRRRLNSDVLSGLPGTIARADRAGIFLSAAGGAGIAVDIQGRDLETLLAGARAGFEKIGQVLPRASVQPLPGLEFGDAQLSLQPRERAMAESGWSRQELGRVTQALTDGLFVGELSTGARRLDVVLRGESWRTPEELADIPVSTPGLGRVPLDTLVNIERKAGPGNIRRVDGQRAVTLRVQPPPGISTGEAVQLLESEISPVVKEAMAGGSVTVEGAASQLTKTLKQISVSFGIAVAILYLVMSALFRSFSDALIAILVLPLAVSGGVCALRLMNLFTVQPMDILTMLGFVTVLGLVVNNAILLVHQFREAEQRGLASREAVAEAVRIRIRPIVMTTLTSVLGMLPLVLIPGAGIELYRGMACVILGGMLVNTVFTLLLLPCLLRFSRELRVISPYEQENLA